MKKPNFLIIGANKAGTSSLHNYLDQHPQIFMSKIKEPTYFVNVNAQKNEINAESKKKALKDSVQNLDTYLSLFAGAENEIAIGESSTAYLANKTSAAKIAEFNPEMKIIAILRNPQKRAYSNYLMYKRWGFEKRSFRKAVFEEINGKHLQYPQGLRYLTLGLYSKSLISYYSVFPASQIKIFLFEDFKGKTESVMKEIYAFLGVDQEVDMDLKTVHNGSDNAYYYNMFVMLNGQHRLRDAVEKILPAPVIGLMKKKPELTSELMSAMNDYFYDDIVGTSKLINKNLDHWLK